MVSSSRGRFSSSFGFVMAAAGSAVGLGNIWGFPTQTAENGGAAFVLIYIVLTFLVAYPVLMAEFTIGRYSNATPPDAYRTFGGQGYYVVGLIGLFTVGCILSFYSLIAGSMIAYFVEPVFRIFRMDGIADWVIGQSLTSTLLFTSLFFVLTILIVAGGVQNGIEKWSSRFMPTLFGLMLLLVIYVMTLEGATEGARIYLLPDFSKIWDTKLITSALGQAFFSLSLGVGGMLVYGSYTGKNENLVKLGGLVTLCDIGVAFAAGLLIIPSMYAASAAGTVIFDENGNLINQANLIFQVLPSLFKTMGPIGLGVALFFFLLMSIASLTSSMAMLETPVAYIVDSTRLGRVRAAWLTGGFFWIIGIIIVFNAGWLMNLVVVITTQYSQPLLGLAIAVYTGWLVKRDALLDELKHGNPELERTLFYRVWPFLVRFVSPILILLVFLQQFIFS